MDYRDKEPLLTGSPLMTAVHPNFRPTRSPFPEISSTQINRRFTFNYPASNRPWTQHVQGDYFLVSYLGNGNCNAIAQATSNEISEDADGAPQNHPPRDTNRLEDGTKQQPNAAIPKHNRENSLLLGGQLGLPPDSDDNRGISERQASDTGHSIVAERSSLSMFAGRHELRSNFPSESYQRSLRLNSLSTSEHSPSNGSIQLSPLENLNNNAFKIAHQPNYTINLPPIATLVGHLSIGETIDPQIENPMIIGERTNPQVGSYSCTFPGCTAPPFRSHQLLNSHANVHSSVRPYFCPVQDCPRAEGRKGFKRKNEMIRHGLVHNSSRYICPYCAYPRPDNLQR
ncbi:hypothetical protein GGI42DRAFT_245454 [Trichoderma sp. SZMC 28013]